MDRRYQVFVSSTYDDLIDERKEATQAILKCNCFPAGMELFPASNKAQWSVIKQVIDDSDFYLLIIAGRYGSLGLNDAGKRVSYTEMEFDYALSQGKPIIAMLHRHPEALPAKLSEKGDANVKRLEKFRAKARSGRMVAFWENKDQLHGEIVSSLNKIMSSTPEVMGWVRATSVPSKDSEEETDLLPIIEELRSIHTARKQIDYLGKLSYKLRGECLANKEFTDKFVTLLDAKQSDDIIVSAIDWMPYSLNYKAIEYIKPRADIQTLFNAQCDNGKIRDTELASRVVGLFMLLGIYSVDYAMPIFNALKAGDISTRWRERALKYVACCYRYNGNRMVREDLLNYIKKEINAPKKELSIHDLSVLLAASCDDETAFAEVYDVFTTSDDSVQREIVTSIFDCCGADLYIVTPWIQRMFFELCDRVYSWNDDEITADLLLYCLFTRTYDIYTTDEIYEQLSNFNDDVFYMFFWQLGYGEFGHGTEESYNLDDEEKVRVTQIIKSRKHPRERKLLEHFC